MSLPRLWYAQALALLSAMMIPYHASALGFELGESKEELKLDYKVSAVDHGTGRVSVTLLIADPGRLGPLSSVYLAIPAEDESGRADLSISLAVKEVEGGLRVHTHLRRDWAERASLQLRTSHLDGKQKPLTWYYHSIPLNDYLPQPDEAKNAAGPTAQNENQDKPVIPASNLTIGQTHTVRLPGSLSDGLEWDISQQGGSALLSASQFIPDDPANPRGPGMHEFTYEAKSEGDTRLVLQYKQPGKDADPASVYQAKIIVVAPQKP